MKTYTNDELAALTQTVADCAVCGDHTNVDPTGLCAHCCPPDRYPAPTPAPFVDISHEDGIRYAITVRVF